MRKNWLSKVECGAIYFDTKDDVIFIWEQDFGNATFTHDSILVSNFLMVNYKLFSFTSMEKQRF